MNGILDSPIHQLNPFKLSQRLVGHMHSMCLSIRDNKTTPTNGLESHLLEEFNFRTRPYSNASVDGAGTPNPSSK
jgi:hypothetical protein